MSFPELRMSLREARKYFCSQAPRKPRPRITDPYVPFVAETLQRYPRLRATVLYQWGD
jgi:hypothetical protein